MASCLIGWDDVELDLDLVNENFEVLGLRLESLFSSSRICYISVYSFVPQLLMSEEKLTVSYERSSYAGNEDTCSRNCVLRLINNLLAFGISCVSNNSLISAHQVLLQR
jgi:hypothetical protein